MIGGLAVSFIESYTALYVGEVSSKNLRGMISTFSVTMFNFGILVQYALGVYVPYDEASRIMLTISVVLLLSCYCLVETPYYLASVGRNEKALKVLCWLRATDTKHVEDEFQSIANVKLITDFWQLVRTIKTQVEVRRSFQITIILQLLFTTLLSMFASFANFIIPNSDMLTSEQFALLLCVIPVIMCLLSSFVLDRFGRRIMLIVSFTLGVVFNGTVTVMYFVEERSIADIPHFSSIAFGIILMHLISFTFALQPAVIALRSEVFPISYKILGINMAFGIASLSYCGVTWLFMKSMELYGMYVNFMVYFACCVLGVVFVVYNVPETKGKTLAEIQEVLKKS